MVANERQYILREFIKVQFEITLSVHDQDVDLILVQALCVSCKKIAGILILQVLLFEREELSKYLVIMVYRPQLILLFFYLFPLAYYLAGFFLAFLLLDHVKMSSKSFAKSSAFSLEGI